MKKILAILVIALALVSMISCDISDTINELSDQIVSNGAEALGDYLRQDDVWDA